MKVELHLLAGKKVRDVNGRVAGRIHSIAGERIGPHCYLYEFHLGGAGFLEKIGVYASDLVGFHRGKPKRVPWQYMDVSDVKKPRLRCTIAELEAMQSALPQRSE